MPLNESILRLCKEKNIVYIDLYSAFAKEGMNRYICDDGLHLNADGYFLWSNILKKYLT